MADTCVEECKYCKEETDCLVVDGDWTCQECLQKKNTMSNEEWEELCSEMYEDEHDAYYMANLHDDN